MFLNIDIVIVVAFLVINLIVGLYFGKGIKTIKDYALGGRDFSTGTLISTIVATWIGGDYLFITLSEVYTTGLHYAIACCGMAICLFITGYIFVPRMGEFLGNISIAEAMGDLYGKHVRIISAITGSIAAAGFIGLQFKVFGSIFSFFLGMSDTSAIFLAAIITIIYSAFGGIRSVTFTDLIQFLTFGVLIPVISIIIWNDTYNIAGGFSLAEATNNTLFNYQEFLGLSNPKFWKLVFLMLLFAFPNFDPAIFQRISMGRNVKQVKNAFNLSALVVLLILLGMSWIGFLIFSINPNLEPDSLVYYIIDNYCNHTGLKAFMLIGITAMCMSTADSNINAASVTLTHDFCIPLNIGIKNELLLSKVLSVLLGIGSIMVALSKQNMLELVFMTQSFFAPVIGIPFMLAIFGFRSTTKAALIGIGSSFTSVIVWRAFFMDTGIESIIPGSIINLLLFVGSHYLLQQKGGWVGIKDNTPLINAKLERRRKLNSLVKSIKEFNFLSFSKANAPKDELIYTGFGVFSVISTIFTMYCISNISVQHDNILVLLYESMLVISVCFMTYPVWPFSLKKETIAQAAWNISIFYILVFCSSFFVLLSNFGHLQFVIFTVNIIVVAILIKWHFALCMIVIGWFLGIIFYRYYTGIGEFHITMDSTSFILYSLLLSVTAIVIFLKPKQEQQILSEQKTEHFGEKIENQEKELAKSIQIRNEILRNIEHEAHTPITGITSMGQVLYENYHKLTDKQRYEYLGDIAKSSERLNSLVNNLIGLSKLSSLTYELEKTQVNLSDLVYDRLEHCKKLYLNGKEFEFFIRVKDNIIVNCDEHYIKSTLDNLIINAITYSKEGIITVELDKKEELVEFSIQDEGIGIPKEEIYDIFESFTVSSRTKSRAGGRGIGLALCQMAIKAHGGRIWAESEGKKGAKFIFTLPIKENQSFPT